MKVKKGDIEESRKLCKEYQELMGHGREERDQQIQGVEGELVKLRGPWEDAKFSANSEEMFKLENQRQKLFAQKNNISNRWHLHGSKIDAALEFLHVEYKEYFIRELTEGIKEVERLFNFEVVKRNTDLVREVQTIEILTNRSAVDVLIHKLNDAKIAIVRSRVTPLDDLDRIVTDAIDTIPNSIPLIEEETIDSNFLFSLTERRNKAFGRLKPSLEYQEMYGLNRGPSPFIVEPKPRPSKKSFWPGGY